MTTQRKPTPLAALLETLEARTHAGTALLAAGVADQQLQDAILTKMRKLSRKLSDELFTGYGPLHSFASKIALAYALGLLDNTNYRRLTIARRVRNKFAHPEDFLDFQSLEIRKLFSQFPSDCPGHLKNASAYIWHLEQVEAHLVSTAGLHIRKSSANVSPNA